jgi:CHRD domain-containing protein
MRAARRRWVSALALIAALAFTTGVRAQQVRLTGNVIGANEVPPVQSPGSGRVTAIYDHATKTLSWTIAYSGLRTRIIAIHFHGPGDSTRNAGIVLPIVGNLESPINGSAPLTERQAADLLAGLWYLNIHTEAHAAGELRAQMLVAK